MAYTPTTWADGDIITAEKMNKLENAVADSGSGGSIVFIHPTAYDAMMECWLTDKTINEVIQLINNGNMVYVTFTSDLGNFGLTDYMFFLPLTHTTYANEVAVFSTLIEGDNIKAVLGIDGLNITFKGNTITP